MSNSGITTEADNDASDEDSDDFDDDGLPTSKFLFSYNGNFIAAWELFIIFVAVINAFTIPFQVFYGEYIVTYLEKDTFLVLDAMIDQIFMFDILINFRTTYLDRNIGKEIKDTVLIRNRYLGGSFTIDLLSSVPFAAFFEPFNI